MEQKFENLNELFKAAYDNSDATKLAWAEKISNLSDKELEYELEGCLTADAASSRINNGHYEWKISAIYTEMCKRKGEEEGWAWGGRVWKRWYND